MSLGGHIRTIFASQIPHNRHVRMRCVRAPYCTYVCIRAVNTRRGKRHTESARVSLVQGATCDGLYSVSPPVNSFFPVLPRVQPYCYRVESRATMLVLITIRIYEALSLRQPSLVPISHRIPPISIYVARIVSRPNRLFLRFPARLSIYNNSVGETWVHLRVVFSLRALYLYRVSLHFHFCFEIFSYILRLGYMYRYKCINACR